MITGTKVKDPVCGMRIDAERRLERANSAMKLIISAQQLAKINSMRIRRILPRLKKKRKSPLRLLMTKIRNH